MEIYYGYYATEQPTWVYVRAQYSETVYADYADTYGSVSPFQERVHIGSTHINIPDGKSSNLAFASRDYGAN